MPIPNTGPTLHDPVISPAGLCRALNQDGCEGNAGKGAAPDNVPGTWHRYPHACGRRDDRDRVCGMVLGSTIHASVLDAKSCLRSSPRAIWAARMN